MRIFLVMLAAFFMTASAYGVSGNLGTSTTTLSVDGDAVADADIITASGDALDIVTGAATTLTVNADVTVEGAAYGIWTDTLTDFTLINNGTIRGVANNAIYAQGPTFDLTNNGTIDGMIYVNTVGANTFVNNTTGSVTGDITLISSADSTFTNYGSLANVTLSVQSDDIYLYASGSFTSLNAGAGAGIDTVYLDAETTTMVLPSITNVENLYLSNGTFSVDRYWTTSIVSDFIEIGSDATLTSTSSYYVYTPNIDNYGTIRGQLNHYISVIGGVFNNYGTLDTGSILWFGYTSSTANDVFTSTGNILGTVDLYNGNDTADIDVTGVTVTGVLSGGNGTDELTIRGTGTFDMDVDTMEQTNIVTGSDVIISSTIAGGTTTVGTLGDLATDTTTSFTGAMLNALENHGTITMDNSTVASTVTNNGIMNVSGSDFTSTFDNYGDLTLDSTSSLVTFNYYDGTVDLTGFTDVFNLALYTDFSGITFDTGYKFGTVTNYVDDLTFDSTLSVYNFYNYGLNTVIDGSELRGTVIYNYADAELTISNITNDDTIYNYADLTLDAFTHSTNGAIYNYAGASLFVTNGSSLTRSIVNYTGADITVNGDATVVSGGITNSEGATVTVNGGGITGGISNSGIVTVNDGYIKSVGAVEGTNSEFHILNDNDGEALSLTLRADTIYTIPDTLDFQNFTTYVDKTWEAGVDFSGNIYGTFTNRASTTLIDAKLTVNSYHHNYADLVFDNVIMSSGYYLHNYGGATLNIINGSTITKAMRNYAGANIIVDSGSFVSGVITNYGVVTVNDGYVSNITAVEGTNSEFHILNDNDGQALSLTLYADTVYTIPDTIDFYSLTTYVDKTWEGGVEFSGNITGVLDNYANTVLQDIILSSGLNHTNRAGAILTLDNTIMSGGSTFLNYGSVSVINGSSVSKAVRIYSGADFMVTDGYASNVDVYSGGTLTILNDNDGVALSLTIREGANTTLNTSVDLGSVNVQTDTSLVGGVDFSGNMGAVSTIAGINLNLTDITASYILNYANTVLDNVQFISGNTYNYGSGILSVTNNSSINWIRNYGDLLIQDSSITSLYLYSGSTTTFDGLTSHNQLTYDEAYTININDGATVDNFIMPIDVALGTDISFNYINLSATLDITDFAIRTNLTLQEDGILNFANLDMMGTIFTNAGVFGDSSAPGTVISSGEIDTTFSNTGSIYADIDLGAGIDIVTLSFNDTNEMIGSIGGGAGVQDTLTIVQTTSGVKEYSLATSGFETIDLSDTELNLNADFMDNGDITIDGTSTLYFNNIAFGFANITNNGGVLSGTITGTGDTGTTFTNNASYTSGSVTFGAGDDTFVNNGATTEMGADLYMGGGADIVDFDSTTAGILSGNINTGAGNDIVRLRLSGTNVLQGVIDLGDDTDTVYISDAGTFTTSLLNAENVYLDGNGTVTLNSSEISEGTVGGLFDISDTTTADFTNVTLGFTTINMAGVLDGTIIGGSTATTFNNTGTINTDALVNLSNVNDTYVQSINGVLNGTIDMGAGDDTATIVGNSGTGAIDGGSGTNDTLSISGTGTYELETSDFEIINIAASSVLVINTDVLGRDLTIGTGASTTFNSAYVVGLENITNNGSIDGNISALTQAVTFINNGDTLDTSVIELSGAVDTITNTTSGTLNGELTLGGGEDVLTNQGFLYSTVDFGVGSDTFINEADAEIVNADLNLNDGDDVVDLTMVEDGTYTGTLSASTNSLVGDSLTLRGIGSYGLVTSGFEYVTIASGSTVTTIANIVGDADSVLTIEDGAEFVLSNRSLVFGTIQNDGVLRGSSPVSSVAMDFTNSLTGSMGLSGQPIDFYLSTAADTFTTHGAIYGTVHLDAGNDVATIYVDDSTWYTGSLMGGDGTDTLILSGGTDIDTMTTFNEAILEFEELEIEDNSHIQLMSASSGMNVSIGSNASMELQTTGINNINNDGTLVLRDTQTITGTYTHSANANATLSLHFAGINDGEYGRLNLGGALTFNFPSYIDLTADAGAFTMLDNGDSLVIIDAGSTIDSSNLTNVSLGNITSELTDNGFSATLGINTEDDTQLTLEFTSSGPHIVRRDEIAVTDISYGSDAVITFLRDDVAQPDPPLMFIVGEGLTISYLSTPDAAKAVIWAESEQVEIYNEGTISTNGFGTNAIQIDSELGFVQNDETGSIVGDILFANAVSTDTFINKGSITGSVSLYDGDDSASIQLGDDYAMTGTLDAGDGDDTLYLTGTGNYVDVNDTNFEHLILKEDSLALANVNFTGILGFNTLVVEATATGNLTAVMTSLSSIDNYGTLNGSFTNSVSTTLTNTGTIANGTVALSSSADTVTNTSTGLISGTLSIGDGSDTVTNAGTISGTVNLGVGSDTFTNTATGSITGTVDLNADDDSAVINASAGTLTGTIKGGLGTDELTITGTGIYDLTTTGFETVTFNGSMQSRGSITGTDVIFSNTSYVSFGELGTAAALTIDTVSNAGTIVGWMDLSGSVTDFTNTGVIGFAGSTTELTFSDTADSLINNGTIVDAVINLGGGTDTYTHAGVIEDSTIDAGAGNDIINITVSGSMTGTMLGGLGTDTLTLDGTSGSYEMITSGFEAINVAATATIDIAGDLSGTLMTVASGATVTMNSSALNVSQLVNNSTMTGIVTGGTVATIVNNVDTMTAMNMTTSGLNDTFNNTGSFDGTLSMGAGADTFNQTGSFDGTLVMGAGNDKATLDILNGSFDGTIDGGDDSDTVILDGGNGAWITFDDTIENVETINLTSDTWLDVTGDLGTGLVTIDADERVQLSAASGTVAGSINNAGEVLLSTSQSLTGDYTQSGDLSLHFDGLTTGTFGQLVLDGEATFNSGSNLNLTFAAGVAAGMAKDDRYLLVDAGVDITTLSDLRLNTLLPQDLVDAGLNWQLVLDTDASDLYLEIMGSEAYVVEYDQALSGQIYRATDYVIGFQRDAVTQPSPERLTLVLGATTEVMYAAAPTIELGVIYADQDYATVVNNGIVSTNGFATQAIRFDYANGEVFNGTTGSIIGDVSFNAAGSSDYMKQEGVITGDVYMGSGNDTVDVNVGTYTMNGTIYAGADTDTLGLIGTGSYDSTPFDGFEVLTVRDSAAVTFDADFSMNSVNVEANGLATFSGASITTASLQNDGTMTGDFALTNAASFTNNAVLDAGFDSVMSAGNDSFTNTATVAGTLDMADGIDTVANSSTINGTVLTGAGNDSVNNTGLIAGTLDMGSESDEFINSGDITGTVDLGVGDDTARIDLSLIQTLTGTLSGNFGTDTLNIYGSGTVALTTDFETISVKQGAFVDFAGADITATSLIIGEAGLGEAVVDLTGATLDIQGFQNFGRVSGAFSPFTVTTTFDNQGQIGTADAGIDVTLSDEADVFVNTGIIYGAVDLGDGDDIATVDASTHYVTDGIDGGLGYDILQIEGTSTAVEFGTDVQNIERYEVLAGANVMFNDFNETPELAIAHSATVTLNTSGMAVGDVQNAGTLEVVGSQNLNSYIQGANGTLSLVLAATGESSTLNIADTATFLPGKLELSFDGIREMNDGDQFTLLTAANGITGVDDLTITLGENFSDGDFTLLTINGDTELVLLVNVKPIEAFTGGLRTLGEKEDLVANVPVVSFEIQKQISAAVQGRIKDVIDSKTGEFTTSKGTAAWMQTSVITGDYNTWSEDEKMEYSSTGIVFGSDIVLSKTSLMGGLLSINSTAAENPEDQGYEHNTVSYQLDFYFAERYDSFNLIGMFGFGLNTHSQERLSENGAETIEADYVSNLFTGEVTMSFDFIAGNWQLVPYLTTAYTVVHQDSYEESGDDAVATEMVHIDAVTASSYRNSFGGSIAYNYRTTYTIFTPKLWAEVGYEGINAPEVSGYELNGPTKFVKSYYDQNGMFSRYGAGMYLQVGPTLKFGVEYEHGAYEALTSDRIDLRGSYRF